MSIWPVSSLLLLSRFCLPLSCNIQIIFMCLSFLIHSLEVHRASWAFNKFVNFSDIMSSDSLCAPFSLSFTSRTPTMNMLIGLVVSHVSFRFCLPIFGFANHYVFFFMCFIFAFSFIFLDILNPYLAVFFNFTVNQSAWGTKFLVFCLVIFLRADCFLTWLVIFYYELIFTRA